MRVPSSRGILVCSSISEMFIACHLAQASRSGAENGYKIMLNMSGIVCNINAPSCLHKMFNMYVHRYKSMLARGLRLFSLRLRSGSSHAFSVAASGPTAMPLWHEADRAHERKLTAGMGGRRRREVELVFKQVSLLGVLQGLSSCVMARGFTRSCLQAWLCPCCVQGWALADYLWRAVPDVCNT